MDISRGYDIAEWLDGELGVPVVERATANTSAVEDYEMFMTALRNGWLRHCDDPELTRHVLNARARTLPGGDTRFSRGPDKLKIDALVSAAMVHTVTVRNEAGSVYDTEALLVL